MGPGLRRDPRIGLLGLNMTDKDSAADIDLLQDLVARAKKAGADAADAVLF